MRQPMNIAHISDFHLSTEHKRYNLRRARRLLDAIARHGVDHIVFTGDIAADADRKDFDSARRLLNGAGLLHSEKLSMVIGNHDIFGGVHTAEDILSFPRRCKETEFNRKVEEFREHFHETFQRCLFASHGKTFPYAKIIGDVALIGVNSVAHYSRTKNPFGSNGEIGDGQFKNLSLLLEAPPLRDKRKVVLVHHHFQKISTSANGALNSVWGAIERQTMKLHGKKRLFELFRRHGVSAVMHGHVHLNTDYERKGIRFLNGGGSLLTAGPPHLVFNLVRIDGKSIECRMITIPDEDLSIPAEVGIPAALPETELQAA